MFSWAQQQMANVAGTREPIYGPSAIQSVAKQAETTPYTELSKDDLKWAAMQSTCVETQTFYLTADNGHYGMAQVIYSNVGGIRTTCQFNTKIFYPPTTPPTPNLWSSTPLANHAFTPDHLTFSADSLDLTLSPTGDAYTIKSAVSPTSLVNLTVTRAAPGFVVGANGLSTFGTDPAAPWGSMRHAFWPRCTVAGSIILPAGEIAFTGRAMFVHALQGMKPHHAAAKWDFVNLQTPTYSAVLMSYTTPPSYGSTLVSVGGVAADGRILCANASNTVLHTEAADDKECEWPEPKAIRVEWGGRGGEGVETTTAVAATSLGMRSDRVDVMAEVPGFVKAIVGGVSGARPYIYQFAKGGVELSVKEGDGEEKKEEGRLYYEATFISE